MILSQLVMTIIPICDSTAIKINFLQHANFQGPCHIEKNNKNVDRVELIPLLVVFILSQINLTNW